MSKHSSAYLDEYENTGCPGCGALLVERYGFRVLQNGVATALVPIARGACRGSGVRPQRPAVPA